jgi:outer membrane lipoprotein-sorting protein
MRRSFIGEIQAAASKPATRADRRDRHPLAMNSWSGAIPVAPASSASRKRPGESPSGETTPTPVIEIEALTDRTLPFRIVALQSRIFVTAGACALALVSLTAARPADLFDDLYARGQKQHAALKTLTATFVETSTSPLLTRPIVSRGRVFVERPSRIALRYAEPEGRVILIEGDRMTVSWPSAGIRTSSNVGGSQRRVQKYFIDSSASELRTHFAIDAQDAGDRPGEYRVTMVPTRKQIQQGLSRLELWVDRHSLLPASMKMTFPAGDAKLMTFTEVTPNAAIDPGMFRISAGSAP